MIGILVNWSPTPLAIVAVYLPSRASSLDPFREAIDELDGALNLLPLGISIFIMGDFNADPGHLGGPFSTTPLMTKGRSFNFLEKWNFLSIHLHASNALFSHTYQSDSHGSFSTIDHILCSKDLLQCATSVDIIDEGDNLSDHLLSKPL